VRNSSRTWLAREVEAFSARIPPGSLVLDAGAGDQPYRRFLLHCGYEAADFQKVDKSYAKSTYVCDLSSIPVEDGRFDAILFDQVMEHLPEPLPVLQELKRVLKPGGRMLATAPLFYEEHEEPYDFYRYTQFAWRYLLEKAGFQIERLEWMEGYFGTVAYQLETASRYLPVFPNRIAPGIAGWTSAPLLAVSRIAFRILAVLFYRLDEHSKFVQSGFPKNYVVVARKLVA
jgi:SAM-dependent methyltransferase